MTNARIKIIIIAFTFIIGVSAIAIWLIKFKPDLNIYSVNFCDLIQESNNYDGKTVRIQAFYKQGYEASFLTDSNCEGSIMVSCSLDRNSCEKIFNSITTESIKSNQVKIDFIGRYIDSEYDSFEGDNVHKLELLEVKIANISQPSN